MSSATAMAPIAEAQNRALARLQHWRVGLPTRRRLHQERKYRQNYRYRYHYRHRHLD